MVLTIAHRENDRPKMRLRLPVPIDESEGTEDDSGSETGSMYQAGAEKYVLAVLDERWRRVGLYCRTWNEFYKKFIDDSKCSSFEQFKSIR